MCAGASCCADCSIRCHPSPPTAATSILQPTAHAFSSPYVRLLTFTSPFFLPCPAPLTSLQPLEFFLSASTGCLLVVAVAALRIFLAWKYVGDRLLTAALEYEETGW